MFRPRFAWLVRSYVVQPRTFLSLMPIGTLINLANVVLAPIRAIPDMIPANLRLFERLFETKKKPGLRKGWVLEYSAPNPYAFQSTRKAAPVIARSVVLAAVALEIQCCIVYPQSARWVGYNRQGTFVASSVPRFIPNVHARNARINTVGLNEKCSYVRHLRPPIFARLRLKGYLLSKATFPNQLCFFYERISVMREFLQPDSASSGSARRRRT